MIKITQSMYELPPIYGGMTVDEFTCEDNELVTIAGLPFAVKTLNLRRNALDSLDHKLPNLLVSLNVSENFLTSMPDELPSTLKYLNCSKNYLKKLPLNTENIVELDCSVNYIRRIIRDFTSMEKLNCSHNDLLDIHVDGGLELKELISNGNKMKNVNLSRFTKLTHFEAVSNEITNILFPLSIVHINVAKNQIKCLHKLEQYIHLETITANHNLINSHFILPASVKNYNFENNPIVHVSIL